MAAMSGVPSTLAEDESTTPPDPWTMDPSSTSLFASTSSLPTTSLSNLTHAEVFDLIASGTIPIPTTNDDSFNRDTIPSLRTPSNSHKNNNIDPTTTSTSSSSSYLTKDNSLIENEEGEEPPPHTLSEFQASEGSVKRQSILRSLFESIPIPSPSPPNSPVASTSTLPCDGGEESLFGGTQQQESSLLQQGEKDARERKVYARELWCKCNDVPTSPTTTSSTSSLTAISTTTSSSSSSSSSPAASLRGTSNSELSSTIPISPTISSSSSSSTTTSSTPRSSSPIASTAVRWTAFEKYAEEKEKELWKVFIEFDSDQDMKLRPSDVRQACKKAGLELKEGVLDDFMKTVDKDGDGAISFAEWRNFLLLLPRPTSMPEIMKYYQTHRKHRPSMSRLTQDGDVVIGGGKTGWNRLMTKSAAIKTAATSQHKRSLSSSALAILQDATNLRSHEAENDEKRWARECVECSTRMKKALGLESVQRNQSNLRKGKQLEESSKEKKKKKISVAAPSALTVKAVEAGVGASSSSTAAAAAAVDLIGDSTSTVDPTPSTTTSSKQIPESGLSLVEGDDTEGEADDHHDDSHHGMFAGAGKFLLAGGLAGAVSRSATAPFDRLKVYLITSPSTMQPVPPRYVPSLGSPEAATTLSRPPVKKIRRGKGSIPAAVRAIWKQGGGVKAFWTGNGLNVIKIFPESAIKFLSYESAKRVFAQYWDKVPDQTMISNSSRFVAGGIGGVLSQFVIYPIETLKTRVMSSTGGKNKGNALIIETALNIWRKGGVKLYFRGLPAGLIGVFPYSAIDMSTFEGIKLAYTRWAGEEPGIPGSLAFGALSGGVGATSVYPLNLVRTRLQAQGTPAHPQTYTGIRDAARKCYAREGWRGFYKGLTPTLVKVIPAVAISYAVYDASKKVLFGREEGYHHVVQQQGVLDEDSLEE